MTSCGAFPLQFHQGVAGSMNQGSTANPLETQTLVQWSCASEVLLMLCENFEATNGALRPTGLCLDSQGRLTFDVILFFGQWTMVTSCPIVPLSHCPIVPLSHCPILTYCELNLTMHLFPWISLGFSMFFLTTHRSPGAFASEASPDSSGGQVAPGCGVDD